MKRQRRNPAQSEAPVILSGVPCGVAIWMCFPHSFGDVNPNIGSSSLSHAQWRSSGLDLRHQQFPRAKAYMIGWRGGALDARRGTVSVVSYSAGDFLRRWGHLRNLLRWLMSKCYARRGENVNEISGMRQFCWSTLLTERDAEKRDVHELKEQTYTE